MSFCDRLNAPIEVYDRLVNVRTGEVFILLGFTTGHHIISYKLRSDKELTTKRRCVSRMDFVSSVEIIGRVEYRLWQ